MALSREAMGLPGEKGRHPSLHWLTELREPGATRQGPEGAPLCVLPEKL